jgi:hypothetical protein
MSMTCNASRKLAVTLLWPPPVTWPRQHLLKFATNHFFDQFANPVTDAGLDRIKPVIEKLGGNVSRWLRKLRLRGNARHGVVSCPALQRRVIRG